MQVLIWSSYNLLLVCFDTLGSGALFLGILVQLLEDFIFPSSNSLFGTVSRFRGSWKQLTFVDHVLQAVWIRLWLGQAHLLLRADFLGFPSRLQLVVLGGLRVLSSGLLPENLAEGFPLLFLDVHEEKSFLVRFAFQVVFAVGDN